MGAAPPRPPLRPSHGRRARKGSGSGAAPACPSLRASRGDPERSESLRTPGNVARDSQMLPNKAKFATRVRYLRRGEGSWAWTRRNLVCGSEIPGRAPGPGRPGSRHRSEVEVGDGRPDAGAKRPARKYRLSRDRSVELFRRGRPTPRALRGTATQRGLEGGAKGAVATESDRGIFRRRPMTTTARRGSFRGRRHLACVGRGPAAGA